ncbi:hypothetical protein J6590_101156, partial [Homalodisca vitripennis]
ADLPFFQGDDRDIMPAILPHRSRQVTASTSNLTLPEYPVITEAAQSKPSCSCLLCTACSSAGTRHGKISSDNIRYNIIKHMRTSCPCCLLPEQWEPTAITEYSRTGSGQHTPATDRQAARADVVSGRCAAIVYRRTRNPRVVVRLVPITIVLLVVVDRPGSLLWMLMSPDLPVYHTTNSYIMSPRVVVRLVPTTIVHLVIIASSKHRTELYR